MVPNYTDYTTESTESQERTKWSLDPKPSRFIKAQKHQVSLQRNLRIHSERKPWNDNMSTNVNLMWLMILMCLFLASFEFFWRVRTPWSTPKEQHPPHYRLTAHNFLWLPSNKRWKQSNSLQLSEPHVISTTLKLLRDSLAVHVWHVGWATEHGNLHLSSILHSIFLLLRAFSNIYPWAILNMFSRLVPYDMMQGK